MVSRINEGPRPGLRQRKKERTRSEIEAAALELFERQGYDATSVEEIAERAEVSPSTFFRYFGSKEDVLFDHEQEYLARLCSAIRTRPQQESLASLAGAFVEFAESLESEREYTQRRARLIIGTPALERRAARTQWVFENAVADELARNQRGKAPDSRVRLLAAVSISVYAVALRQWRSGRSKESLSAIIQKLFDQLPGLLSG